MTNRTISHSAIWLLLTLSTFSSPLQAQTRRNTSPRKPSARVAPKPPPPTFDTLLAADTYKIYGEIRGVGQLIRSTGVSELLDPLIKFSSPPKEFRTLVDWLNAHADEVMTSRMLFAAWPAKPKLPQFLCAIEFASEEEASKFQPKLKNFLPKLLPSPTPTPPPTASATPSTSPQAVSSNTKVTVTQSERKTPATPTESVPPYVIQQAGTLLLLSDSKFNFKDLRPAATRLLREDEKFRIAHDRFSSEPLFLYFDFQTEDRSRPQPSPPPEAPKVEAIALENNTDSPDSTNDPGPSPEIVVDDSANQVVAVGPDQQAPTGESTPSPVAQLSAAMSGLSRLLFGGPSSWPNAIGLGIAFDAESYVIRSLFVNSEENRNVIIPFAPQVLAGPALSFGAPGILPADTEIFISASFDFGRIHDGMIETARIRQEETQRLRGKQVNFGVEPESPFLAYEKVLGINVKRDLIPLLGNEVALALPMTSFFPTTQSSTKDNASDPNAATSPEEPAVILAISVRDLEGMRALLPKLIDSIGVKGASLLAQTERREDTELVSYGNAYSYAFVGDFLVSSTSAKAVRHVVDSYLNRQTLASDSDFHNFTRWQPRQILGQVYLSTKLMKSYEEFASDPNAISDERLRDFIMSLTPAAEPITYSLADEGLGPLHELHLPRKLLLLMIAGISAGPASSPMTVNESVAQGGLRTIASAEEIFKSTKGQGRYGSIQELIDEGLIPPDTPDRHGYKIDLTVFGSGFEARATPAEYGKTGKRSYFIDESSVLRSGDHGGGPATVADQPLQ